MANHHIFNAHGEDVSRLDTWTALKVASLPEGVALDDITLQEVIHQQEKPDVLLPLTDLLGAEEDQSGGVLTEAVTLIRQHSSRVGVWVDASVLANHPDLALISPTLLLQDLIVVVVPVFADGRNFSVIQSLRLIGFEGEIRVAGAFGRDQIAYLLRVGADSFVLSEHDAKTDLSQAFSALASAHSGKSSASLALFSATSFSGL